MKLSNEKSVILKQIAKSKGSNQVLELIELMKDYVSDVRNQLDNTDVNTRLGVVDVLDTFRKKINLYNGIEEVNTLIDEYK